ncbi:MAG: DUF58 domain-containing protein [Candidatus Muiribacteriota bacterium]
MNLIDVKQLSSLKNLRFVAKTVVEGFLYGYHKSPYTGINIEFSEYRPYSFGDELKNIDWKLWGKTDRLYVKKFEEETNMRVWFLLDSSKSMFFTGSDEISKIFFAKAICAALSYIFLHQQDSVGIADFSDKINNIIPIALKSGQFARIINFLTDLNCGGKTDMDKTFSYFSHIASRRGLIIIISDFLEKKENIIRALNYFKSKKNEIIVFHIFSPDEKNFPYRQEMLFIDPETGEKIHENGENIRKNYIQYFNENVDDIQKICHEKKIKFKSISTSDDIVKVLGEVFR